MQNLEEIPSRLRSGLKVFERILQQNGRISAEPPHPTGTVWGWLLSIVLCCVMSVPGFML